MWWKPYEEVDCEDPSTLPFPCKVDPSELRSEIHADTSGSYDGVVDRAAEDQKYQVEHNAWKLTDAERTYFEECKHLLSSKHDEKYGSFDCSIDDTTLNVWEDEVLTIDLITKDETLAVQDECYVTRANRGPLSEKQRIRRRHKMTEYFELKYGQKHSFNAMLLKEAIKVVTLEDIPGLLAKHRAQDQAFYDHQVQIAEEQTLCLPWQSTFQVRPGKTPPEKVRKYLKSEKKRAAAATNQTFVLFRGWKMPKTLASPVPNASRFTSDKEVERSLQESLALEDENLVETPAMVAANMVTHNKTKIEIKKRLKKQFGLRSIVALRMTIKAMNSRGGIPSSQGVVSPRTQTAPEKLLQQVDIVAANIPKAINLPVTPTFVAAAPPMQQVAHVASPRSTITCATCTFCHEEFHPENAITCDTSSLCPDCYEYYLHRSCDHMHSTENAMKGSFLSSQKSVVKYLKYFRAHFLSDQQQLIYF